MPPRGGQATVADEPGESGEGRVCHGRPSRPAIVMGPPRSIRHRIPPGTGVGLRCLRLDRDAAASRRPGPFWRVSIRESDCADGGAAALGGRGRSGRRMPAGRGACADSDVLPSGPATGLDVFLRSLVAADRRPTDPPSSVAPFLSGGVCLQIARVVSGGATPDLSSLSSVTPATSPVDLSEPGNPRAVALAVFDCRGAPPPQSDPTSVHRDDDHPTSLAAALGLELPPFRGPQEALRQSGAENPGDPVYLDGDLHAVLPGARVRVPTGTRPLTPSTARRSHWSATTGRS